MPTGDLPGWHQVFSDDFNGGALDTSKWGPYSGQPGGSGSSWSGWWAPSHWVVSGGEAVDRGYQDPAFGGKWTTAGMSTGRSLNQQYGKYEVRFRVDAGSGIVVALLLWPSNNQWPPEIDFAENAGGGRSSMTATLHYGSAGSPQFTQNTVQADFTQWHTIGVEWTTGQLVYTLDGAPWATVSASYVPAQPMDLALQTQAGKVGDRYDPAPNASTPAEVDLDLDWVVAYAPA